TI
ncbi:Phosphoribosylaminoimidazole-succinocarboxamide synthase, partial [Haemophilus influenzae]